MTQAEYAKARETTEGRVFTVTGGDWEAVVGGRDPVSFSISSAPKFDIAMGLMNDHISRHVGGRSMPSMGT